MRKIYFSGSIRGGRSDARLYRRLIEHIKKTGLVLTEHIGSASLSLEATDDRDRSIYLQDTRWIHECDLLIAECTSPSLGVGYELAYAEHIQKPCHILYDQTRSNISAMLSGNPYFSIHPYKAEEEIFQILDEILRP